MAIGPQRYFKPTTGAAVVIANMIGTGVFTSIGFQLLNIQSGFVLLMLWAVGGLTALCGALAYAELGAALPRSGGEYHFLSHSIHPSAGFATGWLSSTVGFAAPVALAAITFASYLSAIFPSLPTTALACALILILSIIHSISHHSSGQFQRAFTLLKIALILFFVAMGFVLTDTPQPITFLPSDDSIPLLFSSAFAVSLIYVNYAYNGWNAATYLSDELEHPQRDLPRILLFSTLIVASVYLALNFIFLYSTPAESMTGQLEIGFIVAEHILGPTGAKIMGSSLALLLISTVSAMIVAGPRVLQVMGQDYAVFKTLSKTNENGIPVTAIWVQTAISLTFVLTASFESILIFAGFALGLSNFFTVLSVFILRWKQPELKRPYRTWLYPITPLIFLTVMGWTLIYLMIHKTQESLASVGLIAAGLLAYFIIRYFKKSQNQNSGYE